MDNKILSDKIQVRYTEESKQSCNLSCGSSVHHLNIIEGESILDLGCGRGNETIQAALYCGDSGLAVGLDITADMVLKASENAKTKNVSNTKFVFGDIENLPFDDNFFQGAMSNCVINHAKDKSRVYSEIFRTLKEGGRFVVSDATTKYPLPIEIKNDPDAWSQCFGGAITEEEYLKSIHSAGFEDIEILSRREYIKNGYDFISLTIKAYKPKFKAGGDK